MVVAVASHCLIVCKSPSYPEVWDDVSDEESSLWWEFFTDHHVCHGFQGFEEFNEFICQLWFIVCQHSCHQILNPYQGMESMAACCSTCRPECHAWCSSFLWHHGSVSVKTWWALMLLWKHSSLHCKANNVREAANLPNCWNISGCFICADV